LQHLIVTCVVFAAKQGTGARRQEDKRSESEAVANAREIVGFWNARQAWWARALVLLDHRCRD